MWIAPARLRRWLRTEFPRAPKDRRRPWYLTPAQVDGAHRHFSGRNAGRPRRRSREQADQEYVTQLLDQLLGERGEREHPFDWLRGDPNERGTRRRLKVDAYYPQQQLVLEYEERQHHQRVEHFDKPDVLTISGVPRDEQRRRYDRRRRRLVPRRGLLLLVVRADELDMRSNGRLRRSRAHDLQMLTRKLAALDLPRRHPADRHRSRS